MSRHPLRLLTILAALAVMSSATLGPARAAAPDAPPAPNPRSHEERTVERIEIGLLGAVEPFAAIERVLRGKPARRSPSLEVAGLVAAGSTESCFWARPTWSRYNGFGKLASRAWYYIEWCGKSGVVTRVLTLYCDGLAGGGFSYAGCRIRRGATGYSKVNVSGTWRFPFKVGLYTFITRTITVSTRHYATGRYSGTWRMFQ